MHRPLTIAFIHGGGQGSWIWDDTIAALRQQVSGTDLHTLALDVPGCGSKRGRPTDDLVFSDIVDELLGDLEAAELTDIVLVGHSQAGTLLPAMAARRPHLFRRLVYVACSVPLPGQTVIAMIGDDVHGASDDQVGWPVDPKTTGLRERTRIMLCNDMREDDADELMARLGRDHWPTCSYTETGWHHSGQDRVPVSYVVCLQDNILPVNWQQTFAKRFNAARAIKLDCGHQAMNTRPHGLAEILRMEAADIR